MTIDRKKQIVSVERVISATPEQIFELLADPRNHSAFDGSGTVKAANISAPTRLSLGAKFGMDMKMGPSYKIQNEVVEFVEEVVVVDGAIVEVEVVEVVVDDVLVVVLTLTM